MTTKQNNSNPKQKLFHYVIRKDAFLSKSASMMRWRVRIINFIFATLTQKLWLFSPNIFMVTFAASFSLFSALTSRCCAPWSRKLIICMHFEALLFKKQVNETQTAALHVRAVCFWAWFLQLGRIEVGSYSHLKQTVPEFVWKRTETTSSAGSWYGCLVHNWVRLLYSHLPKRSAPKGETNSSSIQSNQTRQVWIHPKRNVLNQTHLMEAQVVLYSWRWIKHVTFGRDHQHKAIEGLKMKLEFVTDNTKTR